MLIEYLKNDKPLFENEPVTSDTTLNKQEIAKHTLNNEKQVEESVIKEDINQEINNVPIIQFPLFYFFFIKVVVNRVWPDLLLTMI